MSDTVNDSIYAPLSSLSEDENLLKTSVRAFARTEIAPLVHDMDEQQLISPKLVSMLFSQGLMGIEVPENYGGAGMSFFSSILAIEEISSVDPAVGVMVDVQNTLTVNALLRWGTPAQKQNYLPRIVTNLICAYALSEASSGSDAFALTTTARKEGDNYVLNGRKLWISNAAEAGLFIIFTTVDRDLGYKGITAFLVEKGMPGFSVGKKENKLGIRASSTCELLLDDCRVPATSMLGEEGKGYKIAMETLNEGRIGIAAQMLGLAAGAFDYARKYTAERRQFGKPVQDFQAVQFSLAKMATQIQACRLMVYDAARRKDAGMAYVAEAAMAKYLVSQIAEEVASTSLELFGGFGFVKEYPVEKLYRDAKIGRIYEGTSNMQLMTIAKQVLI